MWLKFKAIEDCFHRCLVFCFLFFSRPLQKGKKSESHQSKVWPEFSENQLNLLFSFKKKIDNRPEDIFCSVPLIKNKKRSCGRAS